MARARARRTIARVRTPARARGSFTPRAPRNARTRAESPTRCSDERAAARVSSHTRAVWLLRPCDGPGHGLTCGGVDDHLPGCRQRPRAGGLLLMIAPDSGSSIPPPEDAPVSLMIL